MKDQLLIDGDEYLFKACAAVEREVRWDDQNHVLYCNRNEAWDNFIRLINQLSERFDTDEVKLCFSGAQPYFRHVLSPGYKAGRSRKPLCYASLRELCDEEYRVVAFPALEADDVMGILSTKPPRKLDMDDSKRRRIIISQDKDMLGVPGWLSRDGHDAHFIPEPSADHYHLEQTLTGDKTDGYSGCPGVGPVKAASILSAVDKDYSTWKLSAWPTVVKAYEKAGLTEADALLQARLARILRWSDWDREKKEPILWSPGSP